MGKNKNNEFQYHIDSIRYEEGKTVIQGWVIYGCEAVGIDLLQAGEYELLRLDRHDVKNHFSDQIQDMPLQCGFQVCAEDLDLRTSRLQFSAAGQKKTVKIRQGDAAAEHTGRRVLAYCCNWQNVCRGWSFLRRHGFKAFWDKASKVIGVIRHFDYTTWYDGQKATVQELEAQKKVEFPYQPLISILVPTFNTPARFLIELIDSVRAQSYGHWELCMADGSPDSNTYDLLKKLAAQDARIRVKAIGENKGISGNTNEAMDMARGEYIALLDHDDLLTPDALFQVVQRLNRPGIRPGLIYSDEDKVDTDSKTLFDPHFKPDFAPYTLRNNNYICHFTVLAKAVLDAYHIRFSDVYNGAQDYDIILRVSERVEAVAHIPRILYHWRAHSGSTASTGENAKPYTHEAGKRALQDHLQRLGIQGSVEDGGHGELPNVYRVRYRMSGMPKVSIIIPNSNHCQDLRSCIDSIREKTVYDHYEVLVVDNNSTEPDIFTYYQQLESDPQVQVLRWQGSFNYSAINNFAARQADGQYLVFLNNDVKIISDDWLSEMVGLCQQKDVGVVGAKLYYEDYTVQHAGVIVGMLGVAGHCYRGSHHEDYGYGLRLTAIQNLSAVTAAFMMVKREVFVHVGGFDEQLAVAMNDIDLCLKAGRDGYAVVMDPYIEAFHYESKSRGNEMSLQRSQAFTEECALFSKRWGEPFKDPYYNPNFSLKTTDFGLKG